MGIRVHVVSKHESYGSAEGFNNRTDSFKNLLKSLGCDITYENGERCFECLKTDYQLAIDLLKAYVEKGNCEETEDLFLGVDSDIHWFERILQDTGEPKEVLRLMERFLEQAEKDFDYITFGCY